MQDREEEVSNWYSRTDAYVSSVYDDPDTLVDNLMECFEASKFGMSIGATTVCDDEFLFHEGPINQMEICSSVGSAQARLDMMLMPNTCPRSGESTLTVLNERRRSTLWTP